VEVKTLDSCKYNSNQRFLKIFNREKSENLQWPKQKSVELNSTDF